MNPHQITREFEYALCEYSGAAYAVACSSCTAAIQGSLAWKAWHELREVPYRCISMPELSYSGVPAAVMNAGFRRIKFRPEDWQGEYEFGEDGAGVWDSARRFRFGMYRGGAMQCLSFHATKILADSQGGAVLLDNSDAADWLRRYFFDGRTYGADAKTDQVMYPSMHAYMSPDVAARLLWKLQGLPKYNDDLPRSDYPDLSKLEAFK